MSEGDISGLVVMLLGMGVVFFGLICLIFITKLMSAICRDKKSAATPASNAAVTLPDAGPTTQSDRGQFVAAIAAAVATAMGTEPNGLRILSIRKL